MGEKSPDNYVMEEDPPKFVIDNYFSEEYIQMIRNLHKASPLQYKKLEQAKILLKRLGKEFERDKGAVEEISKYI